MDKSLSVGVMGTISPLDPLSGFSGFRVVRLLELLRFSQRPGAFFTAISALSKLERFA